MKNTDDYLEYKSPPFLELLEKEKMPIDKLIDIFKSAFVFEVDNNENIIPTK